MRNIDVSSACQWNQLVLLYFRLGLCPHLGLSSVWPFLSSSCCPPARHIMIGLTVPPAISKQQPCPLRTRRAPWANVCFVSFFIVFSLVFFLSLSFFLLHTWHLLLLSSWNIVVNVVGHFRLVLCCNRETVDVVYAVHSINSSNVYQSVPKHKNVWVKY